MTWSPGGVWTSDLPCQTQTFPKQNMIDNGKNCSRNIHRMGNLDELRRSHMSRRREKRQRRKRRWSSKRSNENMNQNKRRRSTALPPLLLPRQEVKVQSPNQREVWIGHPPPLTGEEAEQEERKVKKRREEDLRTTITSRSCKARLLLLLLLVLLDERNGDRGKEWMIHHSLWMLHSLLDYKNFLFISLSR